MSYPALIENSRRQLALDEGRSRMMYLDHKGIPTIGVGHNLRDKPISDRAVDLIFRDDFDDVLRAVRRLPFFDMLGTSRQGALINMAFQMGEGGLLEFKRMLAALARLDYATAGYEGRDSKWWRVDTPARAERVIRQIESGEWQFAK